MTDGLLKLELKNAAPARNKTKLAGLKHGFVFSQHTCLHFSSPTFQGHLSQMLDEALKRVGFLFFSIKSKWFF